MGKLFLIVLFLLSVIWFGAEWTKQAPEFLSVAPSQTSGGLAIPPPVMEVKRKIPLEYGMQAEESLPGE